MRRVPLSQTIAGWAFILVGGGGLIQQLIGISGTVWTGHTIRDFAIVFTLRLMAFAGGIFVLRGAGWAKWMLLAWMAYHIYIGLQHSWAATAMHVVMFGILAYLLFRPSAPARASGAA
jgi:hypothetical protein